MKNKKCKESLGEARISQLREVAAKESRDKRQSRYVEKGGHSAHQSRYVKSGGHTRAQADHINRKRTSDYDLVKNDQNVDDYNPVF